MKYQLKSMTDIDIFEEGAILSNIESTNIICLKQREKKILEMLLHDTYENVIEFANNEFIGDKKQIAIDIENFCNELVSLGMIERYD